MKGRVGAPPTDLLVCFPSRSHLALMPKPISSSPSRPTNTQISKHHHPPLFRTTNRPSPRKNQLGLEIGSSEPTSPKVTCAGQIKVRHRNRSSRRPNLKNWMESLGLKKDVMNFISVLRSSIRFNMQCFGSLRGVVNSWSDDDEDENEDEEGEEEEEAGGSHSRNVFSKWFMLLEENQAEQVAHTEEDDDDDDKEQFELPPKNALLLMRCRSTPSIMKQEEKEKRDEEKLMLMSYAPDFFKLSTDIVKETWVVGSPGPLMARSRSWKK